MRIEEKRREVELSGEVKPLRREQRRKERNPSEWSMVVGLEAVVFVIFLFCAFLFGRGRRGWEASDFAFGL